MKIALASDHAGFTLKDEIKRLLSGEGHNIEDFGATSEAAVDLADHVYPAALAVGEGRADRGIFVDGVGYGSAMIANKIAGVYAAVVTFGVLLAVAIYVVGGLTALLQHLILRRIP